MESFKALREQLRLSLWFIPGLFAVGSVVGAAALLAVDRSLVESGDSFFRFGGTADAAREVLSAIAQSMLTFTALVFTVTMLVLQLAASQLSPRVMRTFLRDRQNQVVLGLFVATFLFTLLVLRAVRSGEAGEAGEAFVPGLSIWAAFALLVASVGAFIFYIDHMAHAIRASTVIDNVGRETHEAIDRVYPADRDDEPQASGPMWKSGEAELVSSSRAGTLVALDGDRLVRVAAEANVTLELLPMVGHFVHEGAPLFRIHREPGPPRPEDDRLGEDVCGSLSFEVERTLQQDVAFGFRQLVDIATRALSPGTNDPTTAVQAIDQLHGLLRKLAQRPFPSGETLDGTGNVRLIIRQPQWPDFVALACDELRLYGAGHLQIVRRLRDALADVASIARTDRVPVLLDQLDRLDRAIDRDFADERDRARARVGSSRGQGPG